MISAQDRCQHIQLIKKATETGVELKMACETCGISERTYYRWQKLSLETGSYDDLRKTARRPEPVNKLSAEEQQAVLNVMNCPEFASLAPSEIVPALADRGIYLASESTFYRILRKNKTKLHRGRAARPVQRTPDTHIATAPCQVWSWDITYLNAGVKGIFFYLYMIIDIFSRKIVAWEVWEQESAEHASELIRRAVLSEKVLSTNPLVLHSDNGSPMKAATMLETLYKLGITPSRSRPRVSNDNPYSESLFKTLKYQPTYQPKGFVNIEEARLWCLNFATWYNEEHHHSGLNFLTPNQRHTGAWIGIMDQREAVYKAAKASHPERWVRRKTRNWTMPEAVCLNPGRVPNQNSTSTPMVAVAA